MIDHLIAARNALLHANAAEMPADVKDEIPALYVLREIQDELRDLAPRVEPIFEDTTFHEGIRLLEAEPGATCKAHEGVTNEALEADLLQCNYRGRDLLVEIALRNVDKPLGEYPDNGLEERLSRNPAWRRLMSDRT
jgi:hypothetical protein